MDGISSCLISVIIPVYNGQLTIVETVKSVLNQTFTDFELIVINDGSTDSTLDILKKFRDDRIKVYSYPNTGLSSSRNRGIKLARGEFISFIDADDLWSTEKLKCQFDTLQKNPGAVVAYSWTGFIDNSGNLLDYDIRQTVSGYVYQELLKFFFIGSGSNALIRKKVFDEVGLFDEMLTSAEDWDMYLRIATRYHFVAVPATHILYRVTENSMSSNVIRQERETLKVINRAFSQEPGRSLSHLKRFSYANLYIYLTAQAMRGLPDKKNGIIALRFLWRSITNDIFILKRTKLVSILIFKILSVLLLPPQSAQSFRIMVRSLVKRFS